MKFQALEMFNFKFSACAVVNYSQIMYFLKAQKMEIQICIDSMKSGFMADFHLQNKCLTDRNFKSN